MNKILLFIILCIGILPSLRAQDIRQINGTVLDAQTNRPLRGATLILKKNQISAITDEEGRFSLKIMSLPDSLIIRSVGYITKTQPIGRVVEAPLLFRLAASATKLGEVVVSTGYQSLPAERATGSFTQIDNHDLNRQVGSNILDRLKGIANSVSFPSQNLNGIPQIMVRGLSTINGPKEPLIVVDNFPYDGDISNINPNDVERITILKDAAASSIWGARAGNGVIVITTKKGQYNEPMQVHLNSNVMIMDKPDLSNIRTISSSDYIDVEEFLFKEGYYDATLNSTYSYPALSPVVEILNQQLAGQISDKEAQSRIDEYRHTDLRDQYRKYLYQSAVVQQYALNLQGGSKNFLYYLSGGYDKNIDDLAAQNHRYTFRSQNGFNPTKDLKISMDLQYTQSESTTGKPGYGSIQVNGVDIPYLRLADDQGDPIPVAKAWRSTYTDTAGVGRLLDWRYYPLTDWQHQTGTGKRQDLQADLSLDYKLPLGLSIGFKYRYEKQSLATRNLSDVESYNTRDLINQFSEIDANTGIVKYNFPLGGILRRSDEFMEGQGLRGQLNFNRFSGEHRVDAFVGIEARQARSEDHSTIYYGYDKNTLTTARVDYINKYPKYMTGSYSLLPLQQGSLSETLNRYLSIYSNGSWTINEKYILSGSARKDASNLYGVSSNNKWNLLWSAGGAWILSHEEWYHSSALPFLKFRATYGYSGNTDPARTAVLTFERNNTPIGLPGSHTISSVSSLSNPSLRWEKVKTINIGLDFQSQGEIISGSIEAYLKRSTDLYGPDLVDPTVGIGGRNSITKNVADMEGKGVDITLNGTILKAKFKWNSRLIFSFNTDKVSNYYVDTGLLSGNLLNPGSRISPLPGKPVYSIVALKWAGLNDLGEPQGYVGRKISTDYATIYNTTPREDLIYRPVLPRYFGTLINDFQYGRLTLSVCINYRFGYYFMKPALSYAQLFSYGAVVGTGDYGDRWQKPGDEMHTDVPPMLYPVDNYRDYFYGSSTANVLRADNIKLQYVSLSCSFNPSKASWLPFRQMEIYANASNLGLLWKANKAGLDSDFTGPATGKALAIGIKVNF